jgi:hypothetical protein
LAWFRATHRHCQRLSDYYLDFGLLKCFFDGKILRRVSVEGCPGLESFLFEVFDLALLLMLLGDLSGFMIGDFSGLNLERLIWGDLCFIVKDFLKALILGDFVSDLVSDMPGMGARVGVASAIVEFRGSSS